MRGKRINQGKEMRRVELRLPLIDLIKLKRIAFANETIQDAIRRIIAEYH